MTALHTGGCRCGAVRLEASAEPHHVSYCHCGDCRRASGAPVSVFVGFLINQVAFTGKALKMYENGPVTRSFCGICGSPIAYVDERLEDDIYFMLGAMDMPARFSPTQHAYVSEQLAFLHMTDALPRHPKSSVPRPASLQRPDGTVQ
jgi:hypothetical protein